VRYVRPSGQPFKIAEDSTAYCSFESITDGLSNTFFMTEVTPSTQSTSDTTYGDIMVTRGCGVTARMMPNNIFEPDQLQACWTVGSVGLGGKATCISGGVGLQTQIPAARSYHSGGVNFALGDGSVHFVQNSIDARLYQLLATGADGEPASLP
jgi:prepilin-type processing-associated H-X9-DG protein